MTPILKRLVAGGAAWCALGCVPDATLHMGSDAGSAGSRGAAPDPGAGGIAGAHPDAAGLGGDPGVGGNPIGSDADAGEADGSADRSGAAGTDGVPVSAGSAGVAGSPSGSSDLGGTGPSRSGGSAGVDGAPATAGTAGLDGVGGMGGDGDTPTAGSAGHGGDVEAVGQGGCAGECGAGVGGAPAAGGVLVAGASGAGTSGQAAGGAAEAGTAGEGAGGDAAGGAGTAEAAGRAGAAGAAGGAGGGGMNGTEVCGNLIGETWTSAGSPYVLMCDTHVVSLTIEPGVVVQASGPYVFEVGGSLAAVGTGDSPITFTTTHGNSTGWAGILFNAAQATQFMHVTVENSRGSGIRIIDTAVTLKNCTLRANEALQGGGVSVAGSLSEVAIYNSVITGNVATDYFDAGGGLFMRDGAQVDVQNTIISGNSTVYANALGGGVFLCGGTLSMSNTVVVENGATVYGNGSGGITVGSGGLSNCTGGTVAIDSSIVFNNVLFQISGSGVTVDYSNVQGGYSGTDNIAANPLFADPEFHLVPGASPCIDKGNPDPMRNDACQPPGLGEARNDMGAFGGPIACEW